MGYREVVELHTPAPDDVEALLEEWAQHPDVRRLDGVTVQRDAADSGHLTLVLDFPTEGDAEPLAVRDEEQSDLRRLLALLDKPPRFADDAG